MKQIDVELEVPQGIIKYRIVAYEAHRRRHYVRALDPDTSYDLAMKILSLAQAMYGRAWIEVFKGVVWNSIVSDPQAMREFRERKIKPKDDPMVYTEQPL
jgi:hypothetical protein